jgi:twinkle protein
MTDASELNRMLLDRMEEVCLTLLPNGKRKGNHWLCGNLSGDPGESFQVTISGSAAGRFIDFADKETKGASPLWLWSKAKGIKFPEAIKEACDWLGVKNEDFGVKRHKTKTYVNPPKEAIRLAEPNCPVMDYLTLERRLNPIVVVSAKVAESDDGSEIVFPYIEYDKETGKEKGVHRKYIKLARNDGKKACHSTKGTKHCLYGKNLIDENVSELVVCEGEIDALSWHSWGIPAVSVPDGVTGMDWIDLDWEWLSRFEKIYVSMDMDEPGRSESPGICKRLGLHRSYIVSLPKKDANECLVGGVTRDEMLKCLASAKPIELDEIKKPDDFKKDVVDHYTTDPSLHGWDTPWNPELPWRVRPGEFTIFSGFSGSGKTQGLNQLMLHLIQQDVTVMDASLEIRPGLTLYYMTRCAMGKKFAEKAEAEACVDWINERMYFLDCIGTVNVSRVLHAMEYARKRHGIQVFVLDSLFKLGLSSEDWGAQREFADKMTTFCNNTGASVILVAHSRKTSNGNELAVPSKSDVAGSSDLTNAAFNVIIFWRNKMKARKLNEAKQTNNAEMTSEWMDEPDGKIVIDKQRFGEGEESETVVWFQKDSCQFQTSKNTVKPYFQYQNA